VPQNLAHGTDYSGRNNLVLIRQQLHHTPATGRKSIHALFLAFSIFFSQNLLQSGK
jgi:hypothetical protein